MKNKAFTLQECIIVMIVLGLLATIMISNLRPEKTKIDTMVKGGQLMFVRIDSVTRQIISRTSDNYSMTTLNDGSGRFSIASSGNLTRLINLYKRYIKTSRSYALSDTYKKRILHEPDGTKPSSTLKVNDFTGYSIKNGGWIGFKLHNTCGKDETYLYNPYLPKQRTQSKSCGQIFFDVNGEEDPNYLGVDQFIISLKEVGVR